VVTRRGGNEVVGRLVGVRKMPYNLTVRYRSTGKLIGRLDLPDLTQYEGHPLIETGPTELPVAHDGNLLAVTDGDYIMAVDVEQLRIVWKRLIDANDRSQPPAMRFALKDQWLLVLKKDFDKHALLDAEQSNRRGPVAYGPENGRAAAH
jgi:hypothetical protein